MGPISEKKSTKNEKKKFPKMEPIALKLIFVTFAVFTVSAVNKGEDDIMKMLAKEREEMREERKQLTAERQEMREMFRRETARLDEEDRRQREENQKLKEQEQKLKEQNDIQQDHIAKLRRENQKLRRADVKIKQSIRQKDQNSTSIPIHSELKKMMRKEIQTFLKEERLCVGGRSGDWDTGNKERTKTVEFGVPTFIASLLVVWLVGWSVGLLNRHIFIRDL